MTVLERRKAVAIYKRSLGCGNCGVRGDPRDLCLVRRDGSGIHLSRLVSSPQVSDGELWEEIGKRVVVCRRCARGARPALAMALEEGGESSGEW